MYRLPCSLCSFSIETSSTQNQSASTSYLGHGRLILLDVGSGKPASPSLDTASAISNISCLNKDSHWHAHMVHFTEWLHSPSLEEQDKSVLCYSGFWREGQVTYFCNTKPVGNLTSTAKSKNSQTRILPEITYVMQLLRRKEEIWCVRMCNI